MRHRFLTIQYLRGLAAMLVLASHALLYPLVGEHLGYGRLGWLGVILFFVISGFIMVVVTGEERFSARDFLRRRFIRVVPLYWIATLLAAALAFAAPQLFKTTVYDGTQLLLSLLFIPFYNPASGGLHPLYKLGWTLNYEMFFYVCFALLGFLRVGPRVLWLTLAFTGLAGLGLLLQPQAAIPQFYTSFMPLAFCAGAWLGLATLRGTLGRLSRQVTAAIAVLGLAALVEGFVWDRHLVEDGGAFVGLLVFAAALVLLAVRLEPRLKRLALFEQIGDASYSIYLSHIYVVAILSGIAFKLLDPGNLLVDLAIAALTLAGGVAVGWVLYRRVEQPLLARVSRLLGGRRKPAMAAAAAE
ncbi:acyltransferase family protein [Devosia beringensis]|uniref:acyltransferase family protein n=1 Tax=Devosia beringensis TaxID=2657486 RepID=UPI00186B9C6B|nr:acyltransferase [Devosia beringensis]